MDFFNLLWAYILVFIFSSIPLIEFGTIPVAAVAGLQLIPVTIVAIAGNVLTVFLVIVMVNSIQEWRANRKKEGKTGPSKRTTRAKNLWNKYGLPGLALLGPILVGSHIAAFMSVTFGGTKTRTMYWITASIIIWSVSVAILTYLGIDFLDVGTGNNSFLGRYLKNN